MVRKIIILVILAIVAALSFYAYSAARQRSFLPKPEDKAGRSASAFMPVVTSSEEPVAKGTEKLKVTGPVRVYDLDEEE
mgnify:CR=1 FL=1